MKFPEKLDRAGQAARRGYRAGQGIKPTDIEIGDTILDLRYQDCVFTSCSVYRGIEAYLQQSGQINMIKTTNEHNSPGIAGGLVLGGRRAMLMSQNSGAFNEGDGIFTFLSPAVNDVGVLAFMSWRRDLASEPHGEIGRVTLPLTEVIFGDRVFGKEDGSSFLRELRKATKEVRKGHTAVVLMPEEAFEVTFEPLSMQRREDEAVNIREQYENILIREEIIAEQKGTFTETNPFPTDRIFNRFEAAQIVVDHYMGLYDKRVVFVVSNGFNARTLLAIYEDDPRFLYVPGYMGGANAIGAGIGMARSDVHIVVLNGNENNQMSAMTNHLKTDNPSNVENITFYDGAASSVGGARSRELTSDDFKFSRVIQTQPSIYQRFVKEAARVQKSAEHTREFTQALKRIPRPRQIPSADAILNAAFH